MWPRLSGIPSRSMRTSCATESRSLCRSARWCLAISSCCELAISFPPMASCWSRRGSNSTNRFWALVPLFLATLSPHGVDRTTSLLAFLIIATGALGGVVGGSISKRLGSRLVTLAFLSGSTAACAVVPIIHDSSILLIALFLWALFIPDSPQLSSLAVEACKSDQSRVHTGAAQWGRILTDRGFDKAFFCVLTLDRACGRLAVAAGPLIGLLSLTLFEVIRSNDSRERQVGQGTLEVGRQEPKLN